MSIKNNALIVSLSVNKPQMTKKDDKATRDAENANNAHGAGNFRKDLYPKSLVQPIVAVESSARAYIESRTYMWNRGEYLLPTKNFMDFAERISKFEVEFEQAVTAFLNNWSNVMQQAQAAQGDLFDASVYPDLSDLKAGFRFRVTYRPVTDLHDFRVEMDSEEQEILKAQVEQATKEAMDNMLRAPLERLKEVVSHLHHVAAKEERTIINKKTGIPEVKAPIFRDSVCENIAEEIDLLRACAEFLPVRVTELANTVVDVLPHPQQLRDDPSKRAEVKMQTKALLDSIDEMLQD